MLCVVLGPRRALVFVAGMVALVDLYQRLERGVVVAIVRALSRGQRMFHADAAILPQVGIENAAAVDLPAVLRRPHRKSAYSPVVEHHVAVAVGIIHAALVTEQRRVPPANAEQVVRFLRPPPVLLHVAPHVGVVTMPVSISATSST